MYEQPDWELGFGNYELFTFMYSSEHVRRALRPRQHRVRLVVVLEPLLDRIPVQLALRLHRDVVEQAGRAGAVRDFDRRDRLLPRADALQPVAVMVACSRSRWISSGPMTDVMILGSLGVERLRVLQLGDRDRSPSPSRCRARRRSSPSVPMNLMPFGKSPLTIMCTPLA